MLDDGESGQLAFWMILVFTLAAVVCAVFLWFGFKWLRQVWNGHQQLCPQVAELDAYAGAIRTDCNELQNQTADVWRGLSELEEAQVMVSDGTDSIHYGLVEMGGYVRLTELNPDQRRHMCVGTCWLRG